MHFPQDAGAGNADSVTNMANVVSLAVSAGHSKVFNFFYLPFKGGDKLPHECVGVILILPNRWRQL